MAVENIQCADIFSYPVSVIGSTMVGPGEKVFKTKVLRSWTLLSKYGIP